MSEDPGGRRRRTVLFGIACVVVVGLGVGIWFGSRAEIRQFIQPSLAVVMILSGVGLLSPFATSRPTDEPQRRARMRISIIGAAFILQGGAHLVPSPRISLSLLGLAVLIMVATAASVPKGVFVPRP